MDIKALKTDWFFDDITPRGVSFDGFLPQACKTPLGNMEDFELIQSPGKMAEFLDNSWYESNPELSEILMTVSPLESDKHILVDKYRKEMVNILNLPCDLHAHNDGRPLSREACRGFKTLQKDLSRYGDAVMTSNNEFDEGKLYDVKKEIYRLTDRVVSGLAKYFNVEANGAFEVIDELLRKGIISSAGRDNLASASAIGLKLRISTYLEAGKQGEELKARYTDASDEATPSYHLPHQEEIFQFFYVVIPLYEKLCFIFLNGKDLKTLCQDVFFDCQHAVKASIYSRVLNFTEAVNCYERALKTDPDNVNMGIRQLRLLLITNGNTECIRNRLDCLLEDSFKVKYSKENEDLPNDADLDNILASVQVTELRQLLEILTFLSSYQPSNWHFRLAVKLFERCIGMESMDDSSKSHLLLMDFVFSEFYVKKISDWHGFDSGMNKLSQIVDNEGVSTKSIICLNKLAEFFSVQGNYDKSYLCLQRAVAMEKTLYGSNPNLNVMKTLHLLGIVSIQLFKFVEGQYYLEQLLQQFQPYDGPRPRLIYKQACLQLAILCRGMDRYEQAISYLKKGIGLKTDGKHAMEQNFDCLIYCEMAKLWHSLNNNKEGSEAAQTAKGYLPRMASAESRVAMSCYVAWTFHELGASEEGMSLLNQEIQDLDVQCNSEKTAPCFATLGKICYEKRRAVEAESYHKKALKLFTAYSNNSTHVLECHLEVSDILVGNGKPLEGRKKLEETRQYISRLKDQREKCNMLKEVGERWERFGEIYQAATCYIEALQLCKDTTLGTNIPLTEFTLELKLGDLCGKGNVGKEAKEYESYVTKEQRVAAQRNHYDRAGSLLQQYCTRGSLDTLIIELFLSLAFKYANIDLNEMEKHLLHGLEISNVLYTSVISNDMTSFILFRLFQCYFLQGEYSSAADVIERSLRIEMDMHSSNPFHPHTCHRLVFFSFLSLLKSPTSKDTGKLLLKLYEDGLNDEKFPYSAVSVKANAAHCFTFLSLLLWCYHDRQQAQRLNNIALNLFEEIRGQGIPKNRSSSQIICNKIHAILEQPNSQSAVMELIQFLPLVINTEINMWGFLDEYNTRDKLKNIFELIFPRFVNAKNVDMSFFLPRFISAYDQYSDRVDTDPPPALHYSMEFLRQFSTAVYGENPTLPCSAPSVNELIDLVPSAMNLTASLFSRDRDTSFFDEVVENVTQTNYGAVFDNSVEDIIGNALNAVSSMLANTTADGESSVLGSLLSTVDQPIRASSSNAVPVQRKSSFDSIEEDKDGDGILGSYNKNCSEPDKADNGVSIAPSIGEKVSPDSIEKNKDAPNDNESPILRPTFLALKTLQYLIANFFGKESSTLGNDPSLLASQSVDVFKNISQVNNTDVKESSIRTNEYCSNPFPNTNIEGSAQSKTDVFQQYQAAHSIPLKNSLETFETYSSTLDDLKKKLKTMKTMIPVIQKLSDTSIKYLKERELQKYIEAQDNLASLIKSLVQLFPADMVLEKCLTNAVDELNNYKINYARSNLDLAAQFPRSNRKDAWMSKLNGDCCLLEGNYRSAVKNFSRAADYYENIESQEPDNILLYFESLVGLIKAYIRSENVQDACLVCQHWVAAFSQLEPNEIISVRIIELCYLSAKCLHLSKTSSDDLKRAASFCQQGLATFDEKIESADVMECLGKNKEFFALKCELQILLGTILARLNKKEEAEEILTGMQSFLVNVAVGFEPFTASTWEGGKSEFLNISCRLFAWIGRAFLMNGQANSAIGWFGKSLTAFIAVYQLDILLPLREEFIVLLDATATASTYLFPDNINSFQLTVDMCKREILEGNGDVNTIYEFMCMLGHLYLEKQRTDAAIVVYESALAAAECMSNSVEDQRKRSFLQLYLGHAYRLQAAYNTSEGRIEQRALARECYETEEEGLHYSTLYKKLSLACWLWEENKLVEANVLLQELLDQGDKLANIPVALDYSSRFFYGPMIKNYIEEHGIVNATLACLVYSLAVFIYAELGMTNAAVLACEKLSSQRDLVLNVSVHQTSFVSYLLADCQRKLSLIVNDKNLQKCDFPLSPINCANLYYELNEYELALNCCLEILKSVTASSSEKDGSDVSFRTLTCLRMVGNTYIQMGNQDKCYSYFLSFIKVLHSQTQILDLEFEKQCALLDKYSFADRFYIMRSLGISCAGHGNSSCAMRCYEKCLEEDRQLESHQDLVATLAELYQSKALLSKDDKSTYTWWIRLAHDLYTRLFQKTTTLIPFVESSYGLFLFRLDRHREAIDYLLNAIKTPEDTKISFADEDKPLLDAYLTREIEVRTSISLPLKVFVYHQLCTAYMKMSEIEKAQQSALALENCVSQLQSDSDYLLYLSVVGYSHKLIGNKEKAINVCVSVLEKIPNHPPVTELLESYFMDLD